MVKYQLEGRQFFDRERTYDYLIKELHLPAYTGHNLDALWDVLLDEKNLEIEIIDGRFILDYLGSYGRQLLDLFGDLNHEPGYHVVIYW